MHAFMHAYKHLHSLTSRSGYESENHANCARPSHAAQRTSGIGATPRTARFRDQTGVGHYNVLPCRTAGLRDVVARAQMNVRASCGKRQCSDGEVQSKLREIDVMWNEVFWRQSEVCPSVCLPVRLSAACRSVFRSRIQNMGIAAGYCCVSLCVCLCLFVCLFVTGSPCKTLKPVRTDHLQQRAPHHTTCEIACKSKEMPRQ
jgi:hypothetical protein